MIEVFKTNVKKKREAKLLAGHLQALLPDARISFDLEDCDRILRIKCNALSFDAGQVIILVAKMGFHCEVLNV